MGDTPTPGSGYENQSQPNISGRGESGEGPGRATDNAPGAEDRSFQTRPSDAEAAHAPEEGSSVRDPRLSREAGAGESPHGAGEGAETYDPSDVEINRTILRQAGAGQTEIDRQRNPTRGFEPTAPVATEAETSQTPDPEQTDRAQNLKGPDAGDR
jgi:hypothetical protein